jgi:hypothetical protein
MKDDIELIDSLLKRVEGTDLDFKSTGLKIGEVYLKIHFIKDLISLANTPRDGSAYIIYGVVSKPDGTKEIKGVTEHPDDASLQELVVSKVDPIPQFRYRPVDYKGFSLGMIEIFPNKDGPFIPKFTYEGLIIEGTPYCRHGSSNAIAKSPDLHHIMEWMGQGQNKHQTNYTGLAFIDIGGSVFDYPCYFPSISSLRTSFKPLDYLKILLMSNYPWFLISAYDIANAKDEEKSIIRESLKDALAKKKVLLDSGYYESSSKKDMDWNKDKYWDIVRTYDFSFVFSFDSREDIEKKSQDAVVKEVVEKWKRDVEETGKANIIPIVHANSAVDFPVIIPKIVQAINPIMIAVPERELGEGVIATARTIFSIRKSLIEVGSSCPIHLLGTGNPISILIYTTCGANSFDGLEWCQMIINYNTALLHHMKHYDFMEYQSDWASKPLLPRQLAALFHNLAFYISWMTQLRTAIDKGEIINFLNDYLPLAWDKKGQIITPLDLLTKAIPELFRNQEVK